jgi:transcriptional regulator with XRE-family HTH domain
MEGTSPIDGRRPAALDPSDARPDPVDSQLKQGAKALAEADPARSVGTLLRSARLAQGLSQQQLSALTDGRSGVVSRTTISAIERGSYLPSLETLVALARALHVDPADVLERVEVAATATVELTALAPRELRRRAEDLLWAGDPRGTLPIYDALIRRIVLDPPPDAGEARLAEATIEIERARALRRCGAPRLSETAARRAVELSREAPAAQAEALVVLASLHSSEGLSELARITAEKAVALAEHGGAGLRSLAWSALGNVLLRAALPEQARQALLEARKHALAARDHRDALGIEGAIGVCLVRLGRHTQARERFRKAIELARKHGDPAAEAVWLVELGEAALAEERPDPADGHARAALRLARPADQLVTIFRAEWLRHRVELRRSPESTDRHRIAYLRKLYTRIRGHEGIAAIAEFEDAVLGAGGRPNERSRAAVSPPDRPRRRDRAARAPAREAPAPRRSVDRAATSSARSCAGSR